MTEATAEQNQGSSAKPERLSLTSLGGLEVRKPQTTLPFLNLLVYGDSGAGKTLLAGTAALVSELAPVLFIDVEGGTLTLRHFDESADIDVVRVTEWKQMQKVYDALYGGKHHYKTVVLDSVTEMQKLAMASVLGAGPNGKILDTGSLPEFKEWNINTEQIRRFVRAFRDLEINTIFTALAMDHVDPRKNTVMKRPMLTNKLAGELPAFFDVVLYMYVKERRDAPNLRLIQTDKSDRVVAKCRVQGIPEILQGPTMDDLYEMLIRNPGKVPESVNATPAAAGAGGGMKKRMGS